ncbi:LOW QUALITY PROTEIN: hypothetical protein PHPALM_31782 [Phytophthora palmivora]|uniref:Uncharacterized protein n=1 Tax=Phytophthora palmivora TaxID=4796 RepID=A0A2P4X1Q7_9STRA|nr:LOW QUALITY PROTEIN: hypothetical protein PHPALM_31782 [Phytophthora palmivora]
MDIYITACAKTAYCLNLVRSQDSLADTRVKGHQYRCRIEEHERASLCIDKVTLTFCCHGPLLYTVKLLLKLLHRRMFDWHRQTGRGIVTKKKIKQANNRKVAIPPQGTIKTS